jgi:hypothetical protein
MKAWISITFTYLDVQVVGCRWTWTRFETDRYISTTLSFCLFDHTGHQIRISISMFRCGLVNRAIPLNTRRVPQSKLFAKILSYNILRGPDNQLRSQTCSPADKQLSKSSELLYCTWLLIAVSHFDSRTSPAQTTPCASLLPPNLAEWQRKKIADAV